MYIDKIHNVQQILMCLKLCCVPVSVWGASVCLLCFDVCCVFLFVVCVLLLCCSCVCLCFLVLLLISVVFVIFWFFVFSRALCLFLFGVPLYRYAWTHHVMLSCMGCTVGRVLALYHNELPESCPWGQRSPIYYGWIWQQAEGLYSACWGQGWSRGQSAPTLRQLKWYGEASKTLLPKKTARKQEKLPKKNNIHEM